MTNLQRIKIMSVKLYLNYQFFIIVHFLHYLVTVEVRSYWILRFNFLSWRYHNADSQIPKVIVYFLEFVFPAYCVQHTYDRLAIRRWVLSSKALSYVIDLLHEYTQVEMFIFFLFSCAAFRTKLKQNKPYWLSKIGLHLSPLVSLRHHKAVRSSPLDWSRYDCTNCLQMILLKCLFCWF